MTCSPSGLLIPLPLRFGVRVSNRVTSCQPGSPCVNNLCRISGTLAYWF